MKHIKLLTFAIIGCLLFSCDTEEFLNPSPDTAVEADAFFQTDADVESGIVGTYDAIQGVNENTETNINNVNRGIQFEYLLTEHRSDNTRARTVEGSKADFHRYLVDANNVQSEDYYQSMYEIIFRANYVLQFMNVANAENVEKYTAEAKFLRAYAYFNLVRLFGDVPLVTTVIGAEDSTDPLFTRIATATIYEQIVEDLSEGVEHLDNTYKSRASKAAAQALLAKVYLTMPTRNYIGAQQLCEAIIGSEQFSLMSNYNDVFYSELNNEIIFAIQYLSGNAQESQSFSSEFTSGSRRQGRDDGYNIVNASLIEDFNEIGGTRTVVSYKTFPDATEVTKFLPEGANVNATPPTYGTNARNAGNDWIVLRYSDVLLMHVEAILAGGTSTTSSNAITSFQKVRNRAGLTDPITEITKSDLMLERRVELAFENHRWFDLIRFGVANDVLSAHAAEMNYPDYDARDLLLPIPAREINLSGGLLTQNPGY